MPDPTPQGRARIRRLLAGHELSPRKTLGQHFLADPNIIRKIVRLSGVGPGSKVIEVGGGTGTLTAELAATGASVVVYEIDEGLVGVLHEVLGGMPNVEIRHRDVSRVDLQDALSGEPWALVANLPYNVGTGILLDALRFAPRIDRFVVTVQTEVAQRLFAQPGSKVYGIPSIVVALHATGKAAFALRPDVFYPEPNVGSTVVELQRVSPPANAEEAITLAMGAFQQRRKMVRGSLTSRLDDPAGVLQRAGIDPTSRAEQLAPDDFVRLAQAVTT
ncbi:MAG: 16S rRNA (adenine(1518)-N(6)/adenine(1519)-N(6)) -dimethyltransferase RsmA [Acidimicrobiia bacterium]|nr:MAG: 16S rRNA (adenine(1518)-N(6)/adenine(1519)-N(6)) -dimethyltransferase RsmA [Acidimicrobiia bacterium]